MSRHRFVRNIDINEELEDDVISDGGEEELSPEDYERMMDGLEQIRATLGDEKQSAFTDDDIKDALYDNYFDVEQAIADLLERQERRFAARERQDPRGKPLPPPPSDDEGDWSPTTDSASGRHNVPLVRLTASDYLSSSEQETTRASTRPGTLYTITEITERSEDSRDWETSPRHLPPPLDPYIQPGGSRATLLSSITTTDYGQVLERPSLYPDDVAPSPSPSALQRLSNQEHSGSVTPTSHSPSLSSDSRVTPGASGEVPPIDNIPDIPDLKSKSSLQRPPGPSQASLLSRKSVKTTEKTSSEKMSKLSALVSSRSSAKSSASSVSKQSYATETASDVTYPVLRPSAASMVSLLPEKRLPSRPSSISQSSESSLPSSMSRVVNEALQSALALEAMDREAPREPTNLSMPTSRHPSELPSTPSSTPGPPPVPLKTSSPAPLPPSSVPSGSPVPGSPPSEASVPQTVSMPPVPEQSRPLSKLARLAQAKAQEQSQASKPKRQTSSQPGLILPRSHTEYLIPTANGPTATTAITTTYQSLSSLLTKDQSKLPPSMRYETPPIPKRSSATSTSPKQAEQKQSKLAMKSKSARLKVETEPEIQPTVNAVIEIPIFSPKTIRSRASPSAFASLLVNDKMDSPQGDDKAQAHRHRDSDAEPLARRNEARRHKPRDRDIPPLPPAPLPPLQGFAFDEPSPDDIVFNARKGTSLAKRSATSSASSR